MGGRFLVLFGFAFIVSSCHSGSLDPTESNRTYIPRLVRSYSDWFLLDRRINRGHLFFARSLNEQEDFLLYHPDGNETIRFSSRDNVAPDASAVFALALEKEGVFPTVQVGGLLKQSYQCDEDVTCFKMKIDIGDHETSGGIHQGLVSPSFEKHMEPEFSINRKTKSLLIERAIRTVPDGKPKKVELAQINLSTESWSDLPKLQIELSGDAQAVALGNFFYLAGFDDNTGKFLVLKYYPKSKTWTKLRDIPEQGGNFSISALTNQNKVALTFADKNLIWESGEVGQASHEAGEGTWETFSHSIAPIERKADRIATSVCGNNLYSFHWSKTWHTSAPNYFLTSLNLETWETHAIPNIPNREHAPKNLELLCLGDDLLVWIRDNRQWNFFFESEKWEWANSPPAPIHRPFPDTENLFELDDSNDQLIYRTKDTIIQSDRNVAGQYPFKPYIEVSSEERYLKSGKRLKSPLPMAIETLWHFHAPAGSIFWGRPEYDNDGRRFGISRFGYFLDNEKGRLFIISNKDPESDIPASTKAAKAFNGRYFFLWEGSRGKILEIN